MGYFAKQMSVAIGLPGDKAWGINTGEGVCGGEMGEGGLGDAAGCGWAPGVGSGAAGAGTHFDQTLFEIVRTVENVCFVWVVR